MRDRNQKTQFTTLNDGPNFEGTAQRRQSEDEDEEMHEIDMLKMKQKQLEKELDELKSTQREMIRKQKNIARRNGRGHAGQISPG